MLKVFNVVGVIVLLLLLRKLIWCLLPSRDGGRFDAHVQKFDGED